MQLVRLRATYALVAGLILLVGVPLYQAAVLVPAGYAAAVAPALDHRDFAPLLAWIGQHVAADRLYRVLQLVPFLLALSLPGILRDQLWPRHPTAAPETAARLALWTGRLGFALYGIAILTGLFTSAASASATASATTAAARAAAVRQFAASYAVETLMAQVLGGLLLAAFLALVSWRMGQASAAPAVFRFFGWLLAVLVALNALLFALDLDQVETAISTVTLFGLALWLIGLGFALPRMPRMLRVPRVPGMRTRPGTAR
jgi:hypothetical protein